MNIALATLYNWRYKDLAKSHEQKVVTLLNTMDKCSMDFYQGVVFIAQI